MTREELISAIAAAETTAATLRRMLADIDVTPAPCAPALYRRPPFLDTGAAERLTKMSRTWLYALPRRRPDCAWKIETGAVRYSQPALLEIMAGMSREVSVLREESAGSTIHRAREEDYLPLRDR